MGKQQLFDIESTYLKIAGKSHLTQALYAGREALHLELKFRPQLVG